MKLDFKVLPDINAKPLSAKAKIPIGKELEEIHNSMRRWLKDNRYEQHDPRNSNNTSSNDSSDST